MNIDDEIKKLNEQREDLLKEIKDKKTEVNAVALRIRRLQTVKRHATEIIGSEKPASPAEEAEDEFKDPAQIDIELPEYHSMDMGTEPSVSVTTLVDSNGTTEIVDANAIEDFLNS